MCGGKGSRLIPITENTPKPLIKILNRPVLDIIVEKLTDAGITDIRFSLGYMGNEIAEHCERLKSSAEFTYYFEDAPLGTAGGVRNCFNEDNLLEEDILVLSGDNIFNIDINDFLEFHYDSNSDFTVCATHVEDPREYGVITCDEDNSIKCFIEKPTWEYAEDNLVNTGIYLMNSKMLSEIPENKKFDFSDDLFPRLFRSNYRFMCYTAEGFWGDMGEFSSYLRIVREILSSGCNGFNFHGKFYENDTLLDNGTAIRSPCIIADNCKIGDNCVIGPFSVIGECCKIGNNCHIEKSVIGEDSVVGSDCDVEGAFIDEKVEICDNCSVEADCVIGAASKIGRFSRVLAGRKIWCGRKVSAETLVSKDMLIENPDKISFDVFGITAKANSQFSLSDATLLGQSIAGCDKICRVGVGSDNDYLSENFRMSLMCGLRSCGASVYDFGEMFRAQSYFYSAYCNLDFFVFVSSCDDVISLSFFGKNGLPVESAVSRHINNNFKFSSFMFSQPSEYNEIFNMKLFSMVYKSFYKKLCHLPLENIDVLFESENEVIKEFSDELFSDANKIKTEKKRKLQFLLNYQAGELFAVENGRVYSGERILALLCELECASGNNVIIREDAPQCIENNTSEFKGTVIRVYENNVLPENVSVKLSLDSVWTADMFMMTAKLLNILDKTDMSLEALFDCHKNFAVRKSILQVNDSSCNIRNIITMCGGKKSGDNVYYVFDANIGRVRVRQLGNSQKIRIIAEADDMETAKELSVLITQKIKNHNVDKNK